MPSRHPTTGHAIICSAGIDRLFPHKYLVRMHIRAKVSFPWKEMMGPQRCWGAGSEVAIVPQKHFTRPVRHPIDWIFWAEYQAMGLLSRLRALARMIVACVTVVGCLRSCSLWYAQISWGDKHMKKAGRKASTAYQMPR